MGCAAPIQYSPIARTPKQMFAGDYQTSKAEVSRAAVHCGQNKSNRLWIADVGFSRKWVFDTDTNLLIGRSPPRNRFHYLAAACGAEAVNKIRIGEQLGL